MKAVIAASAPPPSARRRQQFRNPRPKPTTSSSASRGQSNSSVLTIAARGKPSTPHGYPGLAPSPHRADVDKLKTLAQNMLTSGLLLPPTNMTQEGVLTPCSWLGRQSRRPDR